MQLGNGAGPRWSAAGGRPVKDFYMENRLRIDSMNQGKNGDYKIHKV